MSAVFNVSVFEESANPIYINENHSDSVFNRYRVMREKGILTDAVILCKNGERFNVHRLIMAGSSKYFFNILSNEHQHATTITLIIGSEAVQTIINFCYSGAAELTSENVEEVLYGAKALEIKSLTSLCAKMLEETLSNDNCIRFLEIADEHQLEVLRKNAAATILKVLPNVSRLPEIFTLSQQKISGLMRHLLNDQDEVYCRFIDSFNNIEAFLPAQVMNSRSVIRATFIAGFLLHSKLTSYRPETQTRTDEDEDEDEDEDDSLVSEFDCGSVNEWNPESEIEASSDNEEQLKPVHVLAVFRGKNIFFNQLCNLRNKWEKSSGKINSTHAIESFRDAVMISFEKAIVIVHMRNDAIYQVECLNLDNMDIESVTLPQECVNWTSLCRTSDQILCFSPDQQHFAGYDLKSKQWSHGYIENVIVAKHIVSRKDDLVFLGCGYGRLLVRSYSLTTKQWTDRGTLRHEYKVTCFKGITMNDDSIYVVITRYDSEKMYNHTEFLVQRFDENTQDWVIVKRFYYSHYVQHFNLAVAESCLYIFYGDGEVEIYNEDFNDWTKGPAIDHGVPAVAMCMVVSQSNDPVCAKQESRSFCVTSL